MTTSGIILSAGQQKRFDSKYYKSLVPFKGETLLDYNIKNMKSYVNKIYVVISKDVDDREFCGVVNKYRNTTVLKIDSGRGCGHALLETLSVMSCSSLDQFYLMWGDSIQEDKMYKKLYHINENIVVPVYHTKKPYVQFVVDDDKIEKVRFSKYGHEIDYSGYQDLSIFKFNGRIIKALLKDMMWRNNELIFLDLFNNYNIGRVIECRGYKKNSFNTVEEYEKLC